MNLNVKKIVERAVVTFLEAGGSFLALNKWDFTNKVVLAGAIGAGLSAAYNLVKQYRQA